MDDPPEPARVGSKLGPRRVSLRPMQRVSVIGSSGSGKSTLARALAQRLSLPRLELDSIYHQPDWQPLATDRFRAQTSAFVAGERWVVDGNYSKVRDLVWARADTVVFLDLPRWRVMSQLIPRSLERAVTGREMWNGNRERWQNLLSRDPERNVVLWSFTRHPLQRRRYEAALEDPACSHLRFVRLRSREQVLQFVAELSP